MRHILWAIAWMGLGLLITLAAANVLQGIAVNRGDPSTPPTAAPQPQSPPAPGGKSRSADPGRRLLLVSTEANSAE